jgi:hypothetical protein
MRNVTEHKSPSNQQSGQTTWNDVGLFSCTSAASAKPETVLEAVFVRIRRALTAARKSNPSGRREGENVKCGY